MPNMDGLSVLKHLRADPATAPLPVLVLTAAGDEGSTRAAFEAGATDYLTTNPSPSRNSPPVSPPASPAS